MPFHRFRLPMPPHAKARPRFGGGRTFTPEATRVAEETARIMLHRAIPAPYAEPVLVAAFFGVARPARAKHAVPAVRPDVDNYAKWICDAGNGLLWEDDGKIVELYAAKVYAAEPATTLLVSTLECRDLWFQEIRAFGELPF